MPLDPRALRPADLVRLLNSTPLGQAVRAYHVYDQRNRAGYRIGDGRTIDLLRYTAWLSEERRRMSRRGRSRRPAGENGRRILMKEEVAQVLGIHPRTVTRYAGEGMPHDHGGGGKPHLYNLAECIEWLSVQGRNPFPDEPPAEDDGSKAGVELKLKREKARLAELDRLEREGALHETEDCRQRRLRQLWALKREFLALPRSAAPELEGRSRAEIESILQARLNGILDHFATGYLDDG